MSKENIEWESEMKRLMNLGVPHDMMANFIRQTLARQKQEILKGNDRVVKRRMRKPSADSLKWRTASRAKCKVCGEVKDLNTTNFYTDPESVAGWHKTCRDCLRQIVRLSQRKNYDPERSREMGKLRTARGGHVKYNREVRQKFPEKYKARYLLKGAVARGEIKKLPCEVCGVEKSEAHHPDYSKPYDVKWLCKKHHALIHRKETPLEAKLTPPLNHDE